MTKHRLSTLFTAREKKWLHGTTSSNLLVHFPLAVEPSDDGIQHLLIVLYSLSATNNSLRRRLLMIKRCERL